MKHECVRIDQLLAALEEKKIQSAVSEESMLIYGDVIRAISNCEWIQIDDGGKDAITRTV